MIRVAKSDVDRISEQYLYHVEVVILTPEAMRPPFTIPLGVGEPGSTRYMDRFQQFIDDGDIRAVDHGEFGQCAQKLVDLSTTSDFGTRRKQVVCLQRCRRGGKTFMASAIAAMLERRFDGDNEGPFVIFISMNQSSRLWMPSYAELRTSLLKENNHFTASGKSTRISMRFRIGCRTTMLSC